MIGSKKRVFATAKDDGAVAEGIPLRRDGTVKAWLSIMYGCNNFCTYCIVPYVRGRERSRLPEDVVAEARQLVAEGYKDITLLGQNVNSYGKDLDEPVDFADLLRMVNDIPGDFVIRFMTSHPKDATEKLFRTMAECEKCAHHIHLPVQSGSDRVLKAMNRHYDRAAYLEKVALARRYMPDLVLTTDIIVGFPGETEEDFADTLSLCEEVRYDAMFTFIYSKRVGTPAASMPDPNTRADKQRRFDRLTELANRISGEKHAAYEGKTLRVLVDGETGKEPYNLSSRTSGGRLVHLQGDPALVGQFVNARITTCNTWALYGKWRNKTYWSTSDAAIGFRQTCSQAAPLKSDLISLFVLPKRKTAAAPGGSQRKRAKRVAQLGNMKKDHTSRIVEPVCSGYRLKRTRPCSARSRFATRVRGQNHELGQEARCHTQSTVERQRCENRLRGRLNLEVTPDVPCTRSPDFDADTEDTSRVGALSSSKSKN